MDVNVSMLFFYRLLMHVMQYKVYCLMEGELYDIGGSTKRGRGPR